MIDFELLIGVKKIFRCASRSELSPLRGCAAYGLTVYASTSRLARLGCRPGSTVSKKKAPIGGRLLRF